MSFLARVTACQQWNPDDYRPFVVAGQAVGRIGEDFARLLAGFAPTFAVSERVVELNPALGDFESRSAAVAEVLETLREQGEVRGWRDEPYPVVQNWGETPLLQVERASVPRFGIRGFGVHLNGVVEGAESPEDLEMWIGRRALTKPTGPGKLDHIAAGGQPHGIGILENMIKECEEEAAIPRALAERLRPVGIVSYRCVRPEGLRDDVLFCFDLTLPGDFEPRNTDGEVDAFYRWPIAEVMRLIRETEDFKFNCALVVIDFLVRRGLLQPDDPDYSAILQGLRLST